VTDQVSIGPPIETAGMTLQQVDELTARLRAAIEALCLPQAAGIAALGT
jgi:hypothetical protein